MNREILFNEIGEILSMYACKLEQFGKLNLLNEHIHSEQFYRDLLNLLYGYSFRNLNDEHQNEAGVDLYYQAEKIVVQISATATKEKIENSLSKISSKYSGCRFKFLSISRDADHLREKSYKESTVIFDKSKDIIDISSLLKEIQFLEFGKLQ